MTLLPLGDGSRARVHGNRSPAGWASDYYISCPVVTDCKQEVANRDEVPVSWIISAANSEKRLLLIKISRSEFPSFVLL